MILIRPARFPQDLQSVRDVFREYADSLGFDLCFQGFEAELAELPGKYAEPRGRVLLAEEDGQVVGCVAMRPLDDGACEMKRLYVAICGQAKEAGYQRMRLDTLASMHAAQALYRSLGFRPIAAYVFNPLEGATNMELDLTGSAPG